MVDSQKEVYRYIGLHSPPAWARNAEAANGFCILGTNAKSSVPALVKIYEQNLSPDSQDCTAVALGGIGPMASEAVPALLKVARDSTNLARLHSIDALGQIHANAEIVVPMLTSCLSDGGRSIPERAARALGRFGTNAQPAIPVLTQLLNDPKKSVRYDARLAIKQITLEADP